MEKIQLEVPKEVLVQNHEELFGKIEMMNFFFKHKDSEIYQINKNIFLMLNWV